MKCTLSPLLSLPLSAHSGVHGSRNVISLWAPHTRPPDHSSVPVIWSSGRGWMEPHPAPPPLVLRGYIKVAKPWKITAMRFQSPSIQYYPRDGGRTAAAGHPLALFSSYARFLDHPSIPRRLSRQLLLSTPYHVTGASACFSLSFLTLPPAASISRRVVLGGPVVFLFYAALSRPSNVIVSA